MRCDTPRFHPLEAANIDCTASPEKEAGGSPNHSRHEPTAATDLENNAANVDAVSTDTDPLRTAQDAGANPPFVSVFDFEVPLIPDFDLELPRTPSGEFAPLFSNETPPSNLDLGVCPSVTVTYSYYSFLVINNLDYMMPQDVNFIESQGCFDVPTNEVLDDFVQQYFLHVHPLLPLLNEGDFWDAFYLRDASTDYRVPLLVFQAMLFSSCPFVSEKRLKALGFSDIRTARATFYRRARLLYCFETELLPVHLAQTALLLSFWAPNPSEPRSLVGPTKSNTAWLSTAIQHCKAAGAHIQAGPLPNLPSGQLIEPKERTLLRRLWWCCIIRDRILALGLRRSLQISRSHFNFDESIGLGFPDLVDEVERSMVYDAKTKWHLMELLVQFVELCSILTNVIALIHPLDDVPRWSRPCLEQSSQLSECKRELKQWYKRTAVRFTPFSGGSVSGFGRVEANEVIHDSVILYSNLIYMFYHATRVAICHHEAFQVVSANLSPSTSSDSCMSIEKSAKELRDAAFGTTKCVQGLVDLGLARWLPISVIPCLALPLVLYILDSKLSSTNGISTEPAAQAVTKQSRLNTLIEAMKTYRPQYDSVDFVTGIIRHVVDLVKFNEVSDSALLEQSAFTEWSDILTLAPGLYLRLVMTLDLGFSNARLPQDADFPSSLRGALNNLI
ncbi:hypothetical protein QQZ08_000350 [Neonectria magnoliae]|uniref:Xylanolytic transcriptional activator regulatory domain-containing protein n=1 Tax=Neonectria magnoliae TaxID=2732573 RepID=A0ABR1IH13_9HYPO